MRYKSSPWPTLIEAAWGAYSQLCWRVASAALDPQVGCTWYPQLGIAPAHSQAQQRCTHRVSISPVSQCQADRVSLYSEHTRLEARVERSSVWKSRVALRCASRDSASCPSTTWGRGAGKAGHLRGLLRLEVRPGREESRCLQGAAQMKDAGVQGGHGVTAL